MYTPPPLRAGGTMIAAAVVQYLICAFFGYLMILIGLLSGRDGNDSGRVFTFFVLFLALTVLHLVLGIGMGKMRRWAIVIYLIASCFYSIPLLFFLMSTLGNADENDRGILILIFGVLFLISAGTNALTLPNLRRFRTSFPPPQSY
jgi:hypothetical protein